MNPTTIVIFGASGDLTARKLVPALYNNFEKKRLPEGTNILGVSRTKFSDDEFRGKMCDAVQNSAPSEFDRARWDEFAKYLFYQPGDMTNLEDYRSLQKKLAALEGAEGNRLFYLSTAPEYYPIAIAHLGEVGLVREDTRSGFRRIIIEKPFGEDLESARALNRELLNIVKESQIYRIDHYLGKETVQNLLVFRFGNAIFEPLWNRNYIDHVQISVAETVGVGHRAAFYDKAGILRDMFQNHLMQLFTLVAMEPPAVFEADALRDEKAKILREVRDISPEASAQFTVRGQYEGYRGERDVDPNSTTETFGAVELFIDNWRWQGVPFYLRSGKMLQEKISEIMIRFHRPPHQIFDVQSGVTELSTNHLSICIQPDEGFHLRFITKVPDKGMQTKPVDMNFHFRDSFGKRAIPEAYERLLIDAINGDPALFTRNDEIELAWKLIDCIRTGWEGEHAPPLLTYKQHTWGPRAADELLWKNGRWWVNDCIDHENTSQQMRVSP